VLAGLAIIREQLHEKKKAKRPTHTYTHRKKIKKKQIRVIDFYSKGAARALFFGGRG
jgi:hypothetical protein